MFPAVRLHRSAAAALPVFALFAITLSGCTTPRAALSDLIEARRLSAAIHVHFTKAAEAANRSVMADTDEASIAAAREAREAAAAVERDVLALRPILRSLAYPDEQRLLEGFIASYAEYRRLDAEILPLAVENTNLKAQRLLFGPARMASEEFRGAVDAAARTARPADALETDALAARAGASVLEIQVLLAQHIAEANDAVMTRLEEAGAHSEVAARASLDRLGKRVTPAGSGQLAEAGAALDRFTKASAEIVALSRRNSNVRSLALSLGRKTQVTTQCDEQLRALEAAIQSHEFTATR